MYPQQQYPYGQPPPPPRRSRTPLLLGVGGGIVLIAVIVLVIVLVVQPGGSRPTTVASGATSAGNSPAGGPSDGILLRMTPGSGQPAEVDTTKIYDACTVLPLNAVLNAGSNWTRSSPSTTTTWTRA